MNQSNPIYICIAHRRIRRCLCAAV